MVASRISGTDTSVTELQVRDEVICFNPGSAGPRRFSLPVTLGFQTVEDGVEASVLELEVG
jgi:uncharacterized protein